MPTAASAIGVLATLRKNGTRRVRITAITRLPAANSASRAVRAAAGMMVHRFCVGWDDSNPPSHVRFLALRSADPLRPVPAQGRPFDRDVLKSTRARVCRGPNLFESYVSSALMAS